MEGSSGNVVLWCEGCAERITLGDPLSVWLSRRTFFECGCGASLTLSDRLERSEKCPQDRETLLSSMIR
jgi:hypothetical protein